MFRQLVRQLVYASLLVIVALRLTCGERRIFKTIKNSQNISVDELAYVELNGYLCSFRFLGLKIQNCKLKLKLRT